MDLTRQIIQIVSEPPGSFIYHLVTLLALQVVFAISYSRWRRQPEDEYARNMSWAAGAIFFGRLILLLAGLYLTRDPLSAAAILPPLEQAINTASVLLLVWSLVPPLERFPRVLDILLISALVLSGVLYLFFAQAWQSQIAGGETAFQGTTEAVAWTLIQIAVLAAGWGYLLFNGRHLGSFPLIILGVLLIAHVIHLWNYPEFIPTNTNVAYWVRIGNLIAYSLWAVYAYLYSLKPFLESESKLHKSIEDFGLSLDQAAQIIATPQPQHRLTYGLIMMNQMFGPAFSAIGLLNETNPEFINFFSLPSNENLGEIKSWILDLSDQPALNTSLSQEGAVQLKREGLGSRQLYAFFEASGLEPKESLLIYPMAVSGRRIGLLALSEPISKGNWSENIENLLPGFSNFVSQALVNSQTPQVKDEEVESAPNIIVPTSGVPAAIVMDKARVSDLEYQLKNLSSELEVAEKKRQQAEKNAAAAQKQARYLAAALRAAQPAVEQANRDSTESAGNQDTADVNVDRVP